MTLLTRISSGAKAWILLALLTFFAAAPGILGVPALDRDESRFAQASKQMLETGDYIQIRYQDEGRNKKPAGIHWLQAGATAAVSTPQAGQIWSYRLPSLLGAILATLATFWCGRILIGRRGAFLGAALFGSGLLLTSEAHIAKTDAVLVFLTALTMGALARLYMAHKGDGRGQSRPGMMLLFWGAMGLAFLIKGPVTMLVAGLAIGVISIGQRERAWLKPVFDWRGLALFGALVLPWFIAVQLATDGAFLEGAVGKDLKDKFVGASEGHGGVPGYHLAFLGLMFFPATLVVVPSLVLLTRTLRGKALDVLAAEKSGLLFLAAWAGPTWIFFELLPTKLSHYILPAYPALGLICGWGLVQIMGGARVRISRFVSLGMFALGGLALCFVASPFGVDILQGQALITEWQSVGSLDVLEQWWQYKDMPLRYLIAGGVLLIGALLFGAVSRYGASVTLAIVASVLIGWHVRAVFLPGAVWMQPTQVARFALANVCGLRVENASFLYLKNCRSPFPDRVHSVGYAEPSLVFTTGTNTVIPPQTQVALPETEAGYPVVYLLNLEDAAGREADANLARLAKTAGRELTRSEPRYGLNYSNGDPVAFVAVRID